MQIQILWFFAILCAVVAALWLVVWPWLAKLRASLHIPKLHPTLVPGLLFFISGVTLHFFLSIDPTTCDSVDSLWQEQWNQAFWLHAQCSFKSLAPDLLVVGLTLIGIEEFDRMLQQRAELRQKLAAIIAELTSDGSKDDEDLNERAADALRQARKQGWLKDGTLRRKILNRARLKRAKLQGAKLEDVELRGADLRGSHLDDARLQRAGLAGSDLTGAWLIRADLRSANLTDACLPNARLDNADLRYAQLQGAKLSKAILTTATKFEGALYDDKTEWPDGKAPPGAVKIKKEQSKSEENKYSNT